MHGISGNEAMAQQATRVKIIHVITRFDKGGSAENTFLTVQGLDKERYDVVLITGPARELQMSDQEAMAVEASLSALESNGVRRVVIQEFIRDLAPLSDWQALMRLCGLFRKERPVIVHTHTSKAGMLGRWAAFFAGVPVIIHTPHGHVFWGYFNRFKTAVFILLERWSARITTRIVTLTHREMMDHVRFRIAPEEKFTVVHSGVDLNLYSGYAEDILKVRQDMDLPQDAFVVGTTGRLTAVKGHIHLLRAAAGILKHRKDIYFVLLGDGELRDDLRVYADQEAIIQNVRFLGWRSDVASALSALDVFVFPSLNEGMGKAIVEAMAMGKPVIASAVGGIPDLVVHGENGLLVPPADSEALAQAILDLYENPDKRESMGEAGKATAAEYGVDAMLLKIEDLYKACLAAHK
jgi:glycosyltransferase involved in cell wall biosynthesis